jgi:hypothetical protein
MKEEVLQKLRQSLSHVESAIEQIERRHPDDPRFEQDINTLVSKQLELQHKILQFTVPPLPVPASVSISSQPAVPTAPPANPAPDDFSPLSFLGWTFGAVSIAGLIAWGMKSKDNMAAVSDIVHTANVVLNPERPAPPFNKL